MLQHLGGKRDVAAVHGLEAGVVGERVGHVGDGHAVPQPPVEVAEPERPAVK